MEETLTTLAKLAIWPTETAESTTITNSKLNIIFCDCVTKHLTLS